LGGDLSLRGLLDGHLGTWRAQECHAIRRKIEDELGAQPYEHIHAICGAKFFDDLITHSEVEKAYERWLDGAFLRQGQAHGSFEYAGILFEEYRGRVGSVDFTDAAEAYFFPVGVPGLFRQYMRPPTSSRSPTPSACRATPSRRWTSSSSAGSCCTCSPTRCRSAPGRGC
jgi:Phage major capsid protein E